MKKYDVAVIGAGITGCAIARVLSRYPLSTVLIDEKDDVAMGASRANSAIVHAGYDCKPGTAMARLNVQGNALFAKWCEELNVPLKWVGSFVIAFGPEDEKHLRELYERGLENGVPDMEIISGDRARQMEPSLNPDVTAALYAPTGGITCPYQLTIACAENAHANGVDWMLGEKVHSITRTENALELRLNDAKISARYVVNAAGLYADEIARMVNDDSFTIRPRKGEYMLLDRTTTDVQTVIFQTPSALGKGILVSPTVDGNSFAGPTAVDQTDKEDTSVSAAGIDELARMSKRSVPGINLRGVITSFAGVRAVTEEDDFILRFSEQEPRMLHAAGICSPGLTSAPALAEEIAHLLAQTDLIMTEKPEYIPFRLPVREFRHMTADERRAAIQSNPLYGRVICRCETVTEAEIVEAIRRGAHSLDAVKRRTRAGMGRCQGGFCSPRVMEILSRELKIPLSEVTKSGGNSWLVQPMDREEESAHE